jgi:multidrug transporter EmrE-like cation transporter
MNFLYILATVLFTVYGQLVVKWQVAQAGAYPLATSERLIFLLKLLLNPWIISGVAAGFLALLCWMIAMTRFDLSYAYPFMSLGFVFVLILSAIFFQETVTMPKMIGVMLIVGGIIISSRG